MLKLRLAVFALITAVINGQGHLGMCFHKWCDHSNTTILNTESYSSIIVSKMLLMQHYLGTWNLLISFRNAIAMTTQSSSISLLETQIWKSELYGQPIHCESGECSGCEWELLMPWGTHLFIDTEIVSF